MKNGGKTHTHLSANEARHGVADSEGEEEQSHFPLSFSLSLSLALALQEFLAIWWSGFYHRKLSGCVIQCETKRSFVSF